MQKLFEGPGSLWRKTESPAASRAYRCRCGRPIFFRNNECLACHAQLGFLPTALRVSALSPAEGPGIFRADADKSATWRRCANHEAAGCNWLVGAAEPASLCIACRLNRTIPDFSLPDSGALWRKLELAKRRLVSQLLELGMPVKSKVSEDTARGLMFDLLRPAPGGPAVLTGHDNGLITLNVDEADDARREQVRHAMHEPYRTLLGHFRHEVGHYYWERLIENTPSLAGFRALFGDETADYAAALKKHYERGPDPGWPQRCVSAYASTHPWEDWAETWAHYLHMVDTMNTALSFGVDGADVELSSEPFTLQDLGGAASPEADRFLEFVRAWVDLTSVLNELSRSMGEPDFYPFVLARPVVAKLFFVHRVIRGAGGS